MSVVAAIIGRSGRWRACCALALAAVMMAGCGFHMQGAYAPAGVDSVYVSYQNAYKPGEPPLVKALKQRLRGLGLLGGPDADARLDIRSAGTSRSGVSISPINANTIEYKNTTSVVFDYSVHGQPKIKGKRLSITRFSSYNEAARLAAEAERRELSASVQKELVDRIMFRIKHVDVGTGSSHE